MGDLENVTLSELVTGGERCVAAAGGAWSAQTEAAAGRRPGPEGGGGHCPGIESRRPSNYLHHMVHLDVCGGGRSGLCSQRDCLEGASSPVPRLTAGVSRALC